ncbi:MAG TPA: hypothetical protein DCE41_35065 [Cytophagales bacterium]|nr:hypothetical protein [Cytophagales bacterium]
MKTTKNHTSSNKRLQHTLLLGVGVLCAAFILFDLSNASMALEMNPVQDVAEEASQTVANKVVNWVKSTLPAAPKSVRL